MKYCFNYNHNNFHLNEGDEWIFKYPENNPHLIPKMKEVEQEHPNIRVIIDLSELGGEPSWDILFAAVREHPKSAFIITKDQLDFVPHFRVEKVDWFFANGCLTWDMLKECVDYGVSDVYIIDELGFDIKNVKAFCDKYNTKVRVYPNIAQTSAILLSLGDYTSFYIRPEDVQYYEDYVDVFEFFGKLENEATLYEIYKEEEWQGALEILISNIHTPRKDWIKNNFIAEVFGPSRLDCRKKCVYSDCAICKNCISAAKAIKERREEEIKPR